MKKIITCLAILTFFQSYGQELSYLSDEWEEAPTWSELSDDYKEEQEIELFERSIVEFAYSEKLNNNLVEYYTFHKKVRVIGDDAIQSNNKVYIGMKDVLELIDARARVINPDGKIVTFEKVNILDNVGEDGNVEYKYFAIDGVEKGSDIEFSYTTMSYPSYEGTRMTFQKDHIVKKLDFTLACPSNLVFAFKSYNGFPEAELDTLVKDKNVYRASLDSIGILIKEDYAAYRKNLMHLIYKLDKNTGQRKTNIVTYGKISQSIYSSFYKDLEKKDAKALRKLVSTAVPETDASNETKIRQLENYLKSHIGIISGVNTKTIGEILSDNYTSAKGMIFLNVQALKLLGIKHELVYTCDRNDDFFDKKFEHYSVLNNCAIYFPKLKMYMAPDEEVFRLGLIPDDWTGQDGLFIKEVEVGDISTGLGRVKHIKPMAAAVSHDYMDITVKLGDMTEPTIDFKRSLLGYSNVYFQSVYNLIDEENRK